MTITSEHSFLWSSTDVVGDELPGQAPPRARERAWCSFTAHSVVELNNPVLKTCNELVGTWRGLKMTVRIAPSTSIAWICFSASHGTWRSDSVVVHWRPELDLERAWQGCPHSIVRSEGVACGAR